MRQKKSFRQLTLPLFETASTPPSPAQITPSAFQAAIIDFVLHGQGDGLINAVAGAGKTSTSVQAACILERTSRRQLQATLVAFNKHIAEHLNVKLRGTPMTARTIHSIGRGCLIQHLHHGVRVAETKYNTLVHDWIVAQARLCRRYQTLHEQANREAALMDLVNLARLTLTPPRDYDALGLLAARFDVLIPEDDLGGVAEILDWGENLAADQHVIDFNDMLWLPYRWDLQPSNIDFMFVDECQDLSPAQLELVLRCRADGGRMLFVGDPAQSIMGFAGADTESFWRIKERTQATELPLSICYRCPTSHLALVRKLVPHIQARPNAPDGQIENLPESSLVQYVHKGDLVLCRLTAPLITWCIRLVQAHIPARVRGVDVGENLVNMARRVGTMSGFDYPQFESFLDIYETQRRIILASQRNSAGRLRSLEDKCDALRMCFDSFPARSIDDLCQAISNLFSDEQPPVWLSTIHRAKGLEHDTVFLLWPHKLPLVWPDQQNWEWAQELNLCYVALTRARQRLVVLQPDGLRIDYTDSYLERQLAQKGYYDHILEGIAEEAQ